MLAVVVAKWVADAFGKSIYEELIELKEIPFLEHKPPQSNLVSNVSDVMATNVVCLKEIESLQRILEVTLNLFFLTT